MWSIQTQRSCNAVVSILDLQKDELTASDIQYPPVITTPGSIFHIHAKPVVSCYEHSLATGNVGISVKTFMSPRRSFGNVGFYGQCSPVPDTVLSTSFVKLYSVTAILQKCGKPYTKFNGILQMWGSELLPNLLSAYSQHKGYEKGRKDDVHSRKFFSKVRSFHKSQKSQHNTQTELGNVNISVHIELVSLYLTDLCGRGLFPPTPNAGHTHFVLPDTEPIEFYPQCEIVWNSIMRLLSFLYSQNDKYLYPVIARAGFYLVDQSVYCSECDCLCSIADFEEGKQSEFDKHHALGCIHRKYRQGDYDLPQRRPEIKLEAPHTNDQSKASSTLTDVLGSQSEADNVSHLCGSEVDYNVQGKAQCLEKQSELMKTRGCIAEQYKDIRYLRSSKQITTSGIINKHELPVSLKSDTASFGRNRASNVTESEKPNEPKPPDFISPRQRNDTMLPLKLKLQLREALVEHGFFYDGVAVRCCFCETIYEISSGEDPSQIHAAKKPACRYYINRHHTKMADRS